MKRQFFLNSCFVLVVLLLSYGLFKKAPLTARAASSGPTPYTVKIRQAVLDTQGKQLPLNITMTVAVITQWHRDPSSNCTLSLAGKPIRTRVVESYSGDEVVGGFRSAKIVHGNNVEWFALDIGCALVQAKYYFGNSVNTHNLISLIPGEPDRTLFHVSDAFNLKTSVELVTVQRKVASNWTCRHRISAIASPKWGD